MTGFGTAEEPSDAGVVRAEIRTVNHRFFNVSVRLPNSLAAREAEVRDWLRSFFPRGHVSCTLRLEANGGTAAARSPYRLDDERVVAYLDLFAELKKRFDVAGEPDLQLLSRFNDIIVREEKEETEIEGALIERVVNAAARQAVAMREEEGARLRADLLERLEVIGHELTEIARRAPERLQAERDRLRRAVRELADGIAVEEARLAQEVALVAERWDVNEELVRFRSHLELFRNLLASDSEEPVGKRLSFLVQEMHREANTIGSKANDAEIAHRVVAIKDEIERLREQVENVE